MPIRYKAVKTKAGDYFIQCTFTDRVVASGLTEFQAMHVLNKLNTTVVLGK